MSVGKTLAAIAVAFAAVVTVVLSWRALVEKPESYRALQLKAHIQAAKLALLELPGGSPEALAALPDVARAAWTYRNPGAFARQRAQVVDQLRMPSRNQAESAKSELGGDWDPAAYPESPALVRDEIRLDAAVRRLARLRAAGDKTALAAAERKLCERLLAAERRFFFLTKLTREEEGRRVSRSLPDGLGGGFLGNGRMVCVGFSLVTHSFLVNAGIRHRALDFPGHSAIAADFSDGSSFLMDPNFDRLVDLASSRVVEGHKTIQLGLLYDDMIARPVDAEKGVRAAELSNLAALAAEPEANAYLRTQAAALVGNGPGSTHTAALIALAELKTRETVAAALRADPSAKFCGSDWDALAGGTPAAPPPGLGPTVTPAPVRLLPVRSRDLRDWAGLPVSSA